MPLRLMIVVAALALGGCAVYTPIQRADQSSSGFSGAVYSGVENTYNTDATGAVQYRIFRQGATGFVSLNVVRENATKEAEKFCTADHKKQVQVMTEHDSVPPHILGNWPRVELVFICKNAPVVASPSVEEDRLARLQTLKSLLDSGALTQREFEAEKAKVLSQ